MRSCRNDAQDRRHDRQSLMTRGSASNDERITCFAAHEHGRRQRLGRRSNHRAQFNVMRFILPRFRALIGIASCGALVLWGAPAARAADPQTYKVELAPTGNGAMDGTLRATSDLHSLRTSAPVSPYGLIARARSDLDRLKTVLESYGYYQSKVTMKIDGLALNDPGLADELTALPKKHDARVQASFALGPLYHLRGVAIDGELPPSVQGALGLKPAAPAVAAD